MRHLFSFFVRCASTCSTSTTISHCIQKVQSNQILIYKSARPDLGLMHALSLLRSPSIIPLLSTCTLISPITLLRRHRKAVSSAQLMVRWTSNSATISMQGSHFFIAVQLQSREPSVVAWPMKSPAGIHQLLCFSDSHFFILKYHLFLWLSLTRCSKYLFATSTPPLKS